MSITKYGDVGTPELLKRKGIKIILISGQPKARINTVSPIHTMYERDSLTLAQFSAGKKLYDCWVIGWGENGNCEVKERVDGGGKEKEITTSQLHAMREYDKGIKAAGKNRDLIDKVVLREISLTKRGMSGQERSRLIYHFRNALNDIARCYGFM